jgi:hypothetical protein
VSSFVFPFHDLGFPIKNNVCLMSSVILCHPMSYLGMCYQIYYPKFHVFCRAYGPVSSCVIPYWLGDKFYAKCMLKVWQKARCHPMSSCAISKPNRRFCSMKYVNSHPVSSHVILGHFLSKMVYFCSEGSLVSSCVIPCHHVIPVQYQSKIEGFAAWNMSSVILCHPMLSLGIPYPKWCIFAVQWV